MLLHLDDVYKKRKAEKLISEVEINVNSYGIYLICGKNGSGKTTIAKLLFEKYPQLISMMLQENDLIFKEESILDNIDMYQDKKDEILNLLDKYKLTYLLEKNPKHLSGGEKRVISLLRVLLSEKKIIILDEPSNDIDYLVFEKIYELIQFFSKQKTILLISHDDRFDQYIKKYEIQDKKLCLIEDRGIICKFSDSVPNKKLQIIKTKNHNFVFYCCFLVSLGVLIYSLWNGLNLKEAELYSKYKPGTYHISSFIGTNTNDFNDSDSLNTSLIRAATKWNKSEYIKKLNDNNKRLEVGLEFDKNSVKKVYPLQFYNIDQKSYTNVTDKMKEMVLSSIDNEDLAVNFQTKLTDFLNTEEITQSKVSLPVALKNDKIIKFFKRYGYQIIFDNQSNNVISLDFNEQLYNEALLAIDNKKNILIEAIIVLKNGTNFMDFIIANHLDKQSFLIQGYELYLLNNEINNFNTWYLLIQSLLRFLLLIVGLLWIIINIYERSNSQRYRVLYYYGFSLSEIERHQSFYYLLKYFLTFVYISCLLLGFIIFYHFQSYVVLFVFVIYVAIINAFVVLIWKSLKRKIRRLVK